MVKRPLVIPTVRVVHVCPPIMVHTNLSDFRTVVQELTGRVKNNTMAVSKRSSSNEDFDKFMVPDSSLGSPFMRKSSDDEDGSFIPAAADDSPCACTHDQRTNHTKDASFYDAWIKVCRETNGALLGGIDACSTIACNEACNNYCNGALIDDEHVMRNSYEACIDGLHDEGACINDALSVVSSKDLSSPNWKATSSYGDSYMMPEKGEEDTACIADMWTTRRQLSELVVYGKPTSKTMARKSQRKPIKKAKLIHASSLLQESPLDHQHLVSNIILNSMDCFTPNVENPSFITPYSALFPSAAGNDLEYLHADYYHHVLQSFEESRIEVFPFSV